MARYYIGFQPSEALAEITETILSAKIARDVKARDIKQFYDLFAPEMLDAVLDKPARAVGISPSLQRIVDGATGTMGKAWLSLLRRLQSQADNQALGRVQALIAEWYPHSTGDSQPVGMFGCETQVDYYQEMSALMPALQGPEPLAHQQALVSALYPFTDLMLDGFVIASLDPFEPGFLLRKVCDATRVTCKAASQQIITRVVKKLDASQLQALGAFTEEALFTLE